MEDGNLEKQILTHTETQLDTIKIYINKINMGFFRILMLKAIEFKYVISRLITTRLSAETARDIKIRKQSIQSMPRY